MTNPLDCNGVAAAREAIRYLSHPETPWSDEQVGAVINAYFAAAKTAEERKRRAAGPSSVKWPMPDPLAKYKALAPSQTAVEPVARFNPVLDTEDGGYGFVTMKQSEHGQWVPLSTLTAQAAALAKAEERAEAAERLTAKCYDKVAEFSTRAEAAQRERDKAWNNLSKVATAIGSVRFMDPPDGGDVTLAEQVARMREALEAAEARVAELEADRDQAQRNRDMWKAQCERQAAQAATNTDFLDFVVRRTWDNPLSAEEALSAIQWHPTLKAFYERSRIDPRRLTHQEKNNG